MGRQVRSQKPDKLTPEDLAGPEGWYGVPALTGGYASRPRLTALLDARPDTPLVVISAPAGTGKTSVTAEWVSGFADSSRTAWVTFDLRDPMFWPAFVACLRRLGAPVPEAGPPDHASTVDRQFLLASGNRSGGSARAGDCGGGRLRARRPGGREGRRLPPAALRAPPAPGHPRRGPTRCSRSTAIGWRSRSPSCGSPTWPSPTRRPPGC